MKEFKRDRKDYHAVENAFQRKILISFSWKTCIYG